MALSRTRTTMGGLQFVGARCCAVKEIGTFGGGEVGGHLLIGIPQHAVRKRQSVNGEI